MKPYQTNENRYRSIQREYKSVYTEVNGYCNHLQRHLKSRLEYYILDSSESQKLKEVYNMLSKAYYKNMHIMKR